MVFLKELNSYDDNQTGADDSSDNYHQDAFGTVSRLHEEDEPPVENALEKMKKSLGAKHQQEGSFESSLSSEEDHDSRGSAPFFSAGAFGTEALRGEEE